MGVDLLSVAGHKLYAPKGVGALYIRKGVTLATFMHGAGQEMGRRPGTETSWKSWGWEKPVKSRPET
jgi:cysteine desulfurase